MVLVTTVKREDFVAQETKDFADKISNFHIKRNHFKSIQSDLQITEDPANLTIFDSVIFEYEQIIVLHIAILFQMIITDFIYAIAESKHSDFSRYIRKQGSREGQRDLNAMAPQAAADRISNVDEVIGDLFRDFLKDNSRLQNLNNLRDWRNNIAHCKSVVFTYEVNLIPIVSAITETMDHLIELKLVR